MEALFNGLSYVLWVAVALGILVFVHELGHFLAARLFGMRVDAFSLGFPPNIIKKQVGDTEYRLGAVPLGGYVKIAGMVDESMDVDGLESEPQPDEYRSKPVWQRVVVISAGVVFNIILAAVIYSALAFGYGQSYTPAENVRLTIVPGSVAAEMGLETGDRVVGVNGEEIARWEDILSPETFMADPLVLTVDRDGERVDLRGPDGLITRLTREQMAMEEAGLEPTLLSILGAVPQFPPVLLSVGSGSAADEAGLRPGDRVVSVDGEPIASWDALTEAIVGSGGGTITLRWARPDSLGTEAATATVVERQAEATVYEAEATPRASGERFVLGVVVDQTTLGQRIERYGPGEAIAAGIDQTISMTSLYFGFIGKLVTGRESVRENVGGPLMIAKQSKEAADAGFVSFWNFVAILSIALAVFNILPIPALDGGHLVFLLYEGVVRREPSLKVRMVVQQVGVALILMLMVFVIFNDAVRWFG
ncbi:MAG: RIP metalloprotease RseP [Bacteroidota bacterium]